MKPFGRFALLADQAHCCNRSRRRGDNSRVFRSLDAGRVLGTSAGGRREDCERACRDDERCTHYAFGAEASCALCEGCAIVDSTTHASWRRMGGLPTYPDKHGRANLTHGRWGDCRFDDDAHSGDGRCRYKTEVEASLSVAGRAWEFYHFLIDFAPRILHAMARDGCASAELAAPGWYPQHVHGTFALASRRRGANASMLHHAALLFPNDGLRIDRKESREALCRSPGR